MIEIDAAADSRAAASTQFVIFNLFGDYVMPRGGAIWTNNLLRLLALLGVSERAARSTLSRMKQKGWVGTEKHGRQTRYVLTRRGRAILEQGNQRIFEPPFDDWDGQWRLVVYSLPEQKRDLRNELRKKLFWYGFGRLAPGTWVSPHDWQSQLEPILEELELQSYVSMFSARYAGGSGDEELVRRCWDIPALEQEYSAFVARHRPEYDALQRRVDEHGPQSLSPAESFVRRFWLTYDFQPFPRKDPNLPRVLLPDPWVGHAARSLLADYRRLLHPGVTALLEDSIGAGNGRTPAG